jgi:hypothetical protein
MPFKDKEVYRQYHREYERKWRLKNPDKVQRKNKSHYEKNKEMHIEKARKWRARNPERHAKNFKRWFYEVKLEKQYGLSLEMFEKMLAYQKHSCAICRMPFKETRHRHVDHCHDTKMVRGILCQKCNLAIGLLQHSPLVALEAAHYLNKFKTPAA